MPRPRPSLLLILVLAAGAGLVAALIGSMDADDERAAPARIEDRGGASPDPGDPRDVEMLAELEEAARREPPRATLRVTGTVRGPSRKPVWCARVEVELALEGRRQMLGRAFTDRAGHYAVEGPMPDQAAEASLRVTALAARMRPGLRDGIALRKGREELRVNLELRPGAVAVGRITTSSGEPLAGVEVLLLERGQPGEEHDWRVRATVRSFSDGRFVLAVARPGVYSVLARAAEHGAARVEDTRIGAAGRDLGTLVLEGAGELAGRARFPDGAPYDALELTLLPAELAPGADIHERAEELTHRREGHGGRITARLRTDATGAFRASGLRPGAYQLLPAPLEVELARPHAVHWTGRDEALLEVRSRLVELELIDARGTALAGASVTCRPLADGEPVAPPQAALPVPPPVERSPGLARTDARGRARLDVPGATTAIGLVVERAGERPRHLRLDLPGEGWRVALRVELEPPAEPGRLRLRVRGGDDEVLPEYEVHLRSAASGAPVERYSLLPRAPARELSPPLEPGEYLARLEPEQRARRRSDYVAIDLDEPVAVRAGETTVVQLSPVHGGRVELELVPPAGWVEETLGIEPGWRPKRVKQTLGTWNGGRGGGERPARATLTGRDGVPFPLRFQVRGRLGPSMRAWLAPGLETGTSQALEPGAYVLTVEAQGFRSETRQLLVHAGLATACAVELIPE